MSLDVNQPVLIVEHYKALAVVVRNILSKSGFTNIYDFPDGSKALEFLRDERPSFILSELEVAPMTGLQLLREVRGCENFKDIPFLMLSAKTDVDCIVAAKRAGVSGFLAKPFTAQCLITHMEKISQSKLLVH